MKHKHAEFIKAWADGATVEVKCNNDNWVGVGDSPSWVSFNEYRVKPERTWPVTNLTGDECLAVFTDHKGNATECLVAVANAAIRRYLEDREVI